jgi:hypothetical protein
MNTPAAPRPWIPAAHYAYGRVIYAFSMASAFVCTIGLYLAVAFPERNRLDPRHLFAGLWKGQAPAELWAADRGFSRTYLGTARPLYGDSLIQWGMLLGAGGVGLAFLAASLVYLRRDRREPLWSFLCFISALLVLAALAGGLSPAA